MFMSMALQHMWDKITTANYKTNVEIKCQLDVTDDVYCRIYCLLNMFRAPLCQSSGAREYYTGGRCLWYLVLWFSSCPYGVELRVMCPVCKLQHANRRQSHLNANRKIVDKKDILRVRTGSDTGIYCSNGRVGTVYNKSSKIPQIHMLQTVAQQGGWEGQYWAPQPNHSTVKWLCLGNRSEQDTCSYKVFAQNDRQYDLPEC